MPLDTSSFSLVHELPRPFRVLWRDLTWHLGWKVPSSYFRLVIWQSHEHVVFPSPQFAGCAGCLLQELSWFFAPVGKSLVKKPDDSFIIVSDSKLDQLKKEGRLTTEIYKTKGGKYTDVTQKPIIVLAYRTLNGWSEFIEIYHVNAVYSCHDVLYSSSSSSKNELKAWGIICREEQESATQLPVCIHGPDLQDKRRNPPIHPSLVKGEIHWFLRPTTHCHHCHHGVVTPQSSPKQTVSCQFLVLRLQY
jgi:hypothetical protein